MRFSHQLHLLLLPVILLGGYDFGPKFCQSLPLVRWIPQAKRALSSISHFMVSNTKQKKYDEIQLDLDSGVSMKVTYCVAPKRRVGDKKKPVLLFLHGSFHGGWCWTEHYFEYFYERGYIVVAPCWRGTGGTFAGEGVKKVKIQEHVADLKCLLDLLPKLLKKEKDEFKPVVIAHSFASLAVMKLLEKYPERMQQLQGIVMMCGVPPSGNGKMTMRYMRRSFEDSYKITVGFAMKKCLGDAGLCRDLFLGGPKVTTTTLDDGTIVVDDHGVSDDDVLRYQTYFARDSEATIDLFDLAKQLPSFLTSKDGKANFYESLPPCMVLGAKRDFIVDKEGVEETARYFNVEPVFVDSPHDIMLTNQWKNGAMELEHFLKTLDKK